MIEAAASEFGRKMDPQHYGALISYSDGPLPQRFVDLIERRRPGLDPRSVIPTRDALPSLLKEFIDAGASKFVIIPLVGDADPDAELSALAEALLPLET